MKTIQSIDKTMFILNYISQNNGTVNLTDISKGLGMAVTTLHGFLSTLEYWHVVSKDANGKYSLGAKLFQLSLYCNEEYLIREVIHPYLPKLADEFGETIHLGILVDEDLIYADKAETNQPFRMTSVVGMTVPYYESAIGLIIKAANNTDIPKEYLKDCNDMSKEGFCLKYEDYMDAYCLAVPITPPNTTCVSGISMVIPRVRYNAETVQRVVKRIRSISRELIL